MPAPHRAKRPKTLSAARQVAPGAGPEVGLQWEIPTGEN